MKISRIVRVFLLVLAAAVALSGCSSSHQARKMDVKEATLVNPDILVKGGEDESLYRYFNPKANIKSYTKIILEPVLVRKDGELDKETMENYQVLANNAWFYMAKELEKDYALVKAPEAGAMRVQLALLDADKSKPVRNALSTFLPIGMAVSVMKYGATGKSSGVGEITAEMRATDAVTGELLFAALDRRVGGKALKGITDTWYNADDALKYWSLRTAYVLCNARGDGAKCVKPKIDQ